MWLGCPLIPLLSKVNIPFISFSFMYFSTIKDIFSTGQTLSIPSQISLSSIIKKLKNLSFQQHFSNSFSLIFPFFSKFPLVKQSKCIQYWFCNSRIVGKKNIDSSSGCAVTNRIGFFIKLFSDFIIFFVINITIMRIKFIKTKPYFVILSKPSEKSM